MDEVPPNENDLKKLSSLMFAEYNTVADDYDAAPFLSEDEVYIVLRDNLTAKQVIKLLTDTYGRFALAGHIAALLLAHDLSNSMIIVEGIADLDGQPDFIIDDENDDDGDDDGGSSGSKQTTH